MGEEFIGDDMEGVNKEDMIPPKKKPGFFERMKEKSQKAATKIGNWQESNRANYLKRMERDAERYKAEASMFKAKAKVEKYRGAVSRLKGQERKPDLFGGDIFGTGDIFGGSPKKQEKQGKKKHKKHKKHKRRK